MSRGRKECQDVVAMLDIPDPFDVRELVRRIGEARGRPIELRATETPVDSPCGIWISARTRDYVFYEANTSRLHQEHIILHELGHMLCDHPGTATLPEAAARVLLPTLDPSMVRTVLGRTAYSEPAEEQAELFATLVLEQANRFPVSRARPTSPELAELLDRIEMTLGKPGSHRGTRA